MRLDFTSGMLGIATVFLVACSMRKALHACKAAQDAGRFLRNMLFYHASPVQEDQSNGLASERGKPDVLGINRP